jgi:proteasome lid subunit RPN8/RPN11
MQEWLQDIEQHFENNYPREGCGVLGVVKGKLKWFPCDNVAEDENDFIIDSRQYIEVSQNADIVGIVHSHPDHSCEASEADIKSCNAVNIPYYIFSYPSMEMSILQPNKKEKNLYGRSYEFGVSDCFEAARDYYIKEGLNIPNRPLFEDNWWDKELDYFTDDYIKTWGFTKVSGPMKKGDLLIFTIQESVADHCGVYLGDDTFYHHAENRLSCRESLFPFWKKYITGVYRYDA